MSPFPPPAGEVVRRTRPQRLGLALGAVMTVILLAAAAALTYGLHRLDRIERVDLALEAAAPGDPENFLFIGSDSRDSIDQDDPMADAFLAGDIGGRRSDTMVLARVDPAAPSVSMLPIPRDLWVPVAGEPGHQRVNAAYAGGPQHLVDTVERYLEVPVHHYVEVDFAGFRNIVDALGGVRMYVDRPLRDPGSGLDVATPGCITFDGQSALAFARARKLEVRDGRGRWVADPSGDLGRITRQQYFLRRAIDRASGLGLDDLITLNRLLAIVTDHVSMDATLGLDDLIGLARTFSSFGGDEVATYSLPVRDHRTPGGAAVLVLDERGAQDELAVFRDRNPGPVTPEDVALTVLNGSGMRGHAGRVADGLSSLGFAVARVGDGEPVDATTIRHASGLWAEADLVARHVAGGAHVVMDPTLVDGVVLVTGPEPTEVRTPADASSGPTQPTAEQAGAGTARPSVEAPVGHVPAAPGGVRCG